MALILILFYLFICLFTYLFINFLPLLVSAQWTLGPLEESWEFIAVKLLIAFEVSFIEERVSCCSHFTGPELTNALAEASIENINLNNVT